MSETTLIARPEGAPPGQLQSGTGKRPAMTWHDYLVFLLHVAAEVEHGLMVMYLYAGYSLGGEQVPKHHRPMVLRWRSSILAIAKEEMGHLLTVQNLLLALGAQINLNRQDFPWDVQYYPFNFKLEPLTMTSLSCYLYAEMPSDGFTPVKGKKQPARYREFIEEDRAKIVAAASKCATGGAPHQVGAIYDEIIEIISDRTKIPDSAFRERSYPLQASWDDWGRGYRPDPKMLDAEGTVIPEEARRRGAVEAAQPASSREAVVLIDRIATRTQAVDALRKLSAQGEALHLGADATGEPSHFDRFLEIYQEFEDIEAEGWSPSRSIAVNPTTVDLADVGNNGEFIEHETTRVWGELFNLRYRMLLVYLAHSFRLARAVRLGVPNVRAMTMHKVFGEMYNIKTLACILMEAPLDDSGSGRFAGPPFETPFTMDIPATEADTWRLHGELIDSSIELCRDLRRLGADNEDYLQALGELDRAARAWVDKIIDGLGVGERMGR